MSLTMSSGCRQTGGGPGAPPSGRAATAPANRLAREKSPYLLQHSHNPVDWYPWGEEAFRKARREDKPIFLSIGYSTCHWCHVMERESFEEERIARRINESFVPVKVDREERPDVDRVYMAYVQAATGSGGWPLTVFLTPDLKPFFGGTYFPPEGRWGVPGLPDVLQQVRQAWETDRPRIEESAAGVAAALQESLAPAEPDAPPAGDAAMGQAYKQFLSGFDPAHGGFGPAPKFPQPPVLQFLLRTSARAGGGRSRDMVLRTLREMEAGGIHDQLGGGFHRYSTDERWFLPHFEKMLYDQAQLACCCLEAYQSSGQESFADLARDILDYVLRDMTGPEGEFYSAEDADSAVAPDRPHEQAEGRFYVWTQQEIRAVLDAPLERLATYRYGAEAGGNVRSDPHGEFAGRNVLYAAHTVEETAREFGLSAEQARVELAAARRRLLATRATRPRPQRDDKAVTAWNGLMISAFARGGAILGEPRYRQAAERAAEFLLRRAYVPATGIVHRRLREGEAKVEGFLEDYAFLVQGLIDLYEGTLRIDWLKSALELQQRQDEWFWDERSGGYFATNGRDDSILVRAKDAADGAEPSGNGVAAMNLLRLESMTGREDLARKAARTLQAFAGAMRRLPAAMPQMLCALDFQRGLAVQVVLAGRSDAPDTQALLREVFRHHLPNKVVLLADGGEAQRFLSQRVEFLRGVHPLEGKAAAYVCRDFSCRLPTTDPHVLRGLLAEAGQPTSSPAPPRAD